MNIRVIYTVAFITIFITLQKGFALNGGDISVRMISGYIWMDNVCTAGGPVGKVVAFRIKNIKGSTIRNLNVSLGTISFTAVGGTSYISGAPSYSCRTATGIYLGNLAAGDSTTAYYYIGYSCLSYVNNTKLTTDYVTFPLTFTDNLSGSVGVSFQAFNYVLKNSNNNTITVIATSTDIIGGITTISAAYGISNVKPTNIIDMELSALNTFPSGYSIMGCKITSSNIPSDFAVNTRDVFYSGSTVSNMSSGGNVTIEWYLKIENSATGISVSNINPYIVSDAGSDQRWQANTVTFTGTVVPVNRITVIKRANWKNVYPSDTVVYTIVIKNMSTTDDIILDKLVDVLPRDYQFLHMETNALVYAKLVTYSNCSQYPAYQSTGILTFCGHVKFSPNVYSWVVPKNDSVKLVYSARVSSVPGVNDTNKIAAYIATMNVGTSFAVTNVLAPLLADMLYVNAEASGNRVKVSWATLQEHNCKNFILQRQVSEDADFVTIADIAGAGNATDQHVYQWEDNDAVQPDNRQPVVYKLIQNDYDGQSADYVVSVTIHSADNGYRLYQSPDNIITVSNMKAGIKTINVMLTDLSGRTLYTGVVNREGNMFSVPYDASSQSGNLIVVVIEQAGNIRSEKMLVN